MHIGMARSVSDCVVLAACLPGQQCTLPWSNIRPRWSAPPSWLRRSSGLAIGVQPSCRLHWLRSGLFARSRLGLPNTTGVGFLGGSSWWQLFPLRFSPCGRSTRSCWIRRLTEVRHTQGSFSYGGTTACGASPIKYVFACGSFKFAHPKIILAGLGFSSG